MFEIGKLYAFLTHPARIAFVLLLIGIALLFTRRWRAARGLLGVLAVVSVFLNAVPVGNWLTWQLEARFPRLESAPPRVDGIILLGGEINQRLTLAHGQPVIGRGASRLLAFADLSRKYPDARLIFSGGSGDPLDQRRTEAQAMPIALKAIGMDAARVEFESRSRNTYENALFSKLVAAPKAGEIWLVVTSAFHVPRTVGAFRAAGFPVLPYAVDFSDTEGFYFGLSFDHGFSSLALPLKEFAGLLAYRIAGYTDALFPAP